MALCREMRGLARQALDALSQNNSGAVAVVKGAMQRAVADLARELPADFPASRIGDLRRHIGFSVKNDYEDILSFDIPDVEEKIDAHARRAVVVEPQLGFEALLDPTVRAAAARHFHAGDFRNAVLDAVTAVFDKIRERTGLDLDGDRLINQTLSVGAPVLVLSDVDTESGRNDQSGFADIFRGFYRGVRNPQAHTLLHDLDAEKASQYLVLASILMRRITEAQLVRVAGA
jgi:uncharacterized protein (TIGR02391 family)